MNATLVRSRRRAQRGTLAAAVLAAISASLPLAHAAPCAGFDDVDDGSAFCPSVEWMKNRAVTTGCGGSSYCPGASVSRLAMAAFMKRLGDAMTPAALSADDAPGGIDLDAGTVVCQTGAFDVTGHPRTAYADATVSATAASATSFAADLVLSSDGGANWTALDATPNRGSAPANEWGGASDTGARSLEVGQSIRFGLRVARGGLAGTGNLADSRCHVRVLVYSRTGTVSPL